MGTMQQQQLTNLEHENNCGEERNGLATSIEGEYWGGRYQPTLEMPIGHITRPCAITNQPNN